MTSENPNNSVKKPHACSKKSCKKNIQPGDINTMSSEEVQVLNPDQATVPAPVEEPAADQPVLLPGEVTISKKYDRLVINAVNKIKLALCKDAGYPVDIHFTVISHGKIDGKLYVKVGVKNSFLHVCILCDGRKYTCKKVAYDEERDSKMFKFDE